MADTSQNGQTQETDHGTEGGAIQTADQDPRRRKANRVTVFLSIVTLAVFSILASIAVAHWQKGGLGNYWYAFGWGVAAYVMLGFGTAFTYYYAIIKPAQADQRARQQRREQREQSINRERPELFVEQVIIEPFQVGKPEMVSLIFRNRGKAVAENITVETTHAHRPENFDGPLVYDTKPPESVLTIGPDAVFTMVSRSPWVTNASWIQEIMNGDRLLFVYGKGHYDDRNGTKYPISFCFMYEPTLPRNMVICPTRFLPIDKPKQEEVKPTIAAARSVGSIDAGVEARGAAPSEPPSKWTDYREDYFHGAIWRWKYRPEMGKVPRNIYGYCPECERVLKFRPDIGQSRKPDGTVVTSYYCNKHFGRWYWVRSTTRDPLDGIRDLIIEKLQSGAWREVVKKQTDAREGRV